MTIHRLPPRILDLWSRWTCQEEFSHDDAAELVKLLTSPSGPWKELLEDRRMDGALKALARVATEQDLFVAQVMERRALEQEKDAFVDAVAKRLTNVPQRSMRRWVGWDLALAFTAGVLCCVAAVRWIDVGRRTPIYSGHMPTETQELQQESGRGVNRGRSNLNAVVASQQAESEAPLVVTDAVVVAVNGPATVLNGGKRRRAAVGMAITLTDRVETDSRSNVSLRFSDGTSLAVGRSTSVASFGSLPTEVGSPAQRRIQLDRGALTASVTPSSASNIVTYFITAQAQVRVVGTELSLRVSPDATRVFVEHGVVELRRGDAGVPTKLRAQQWANVSGTSAISTQDIRGKILFVTGNLILSEGDQQTLEHLETAGWAVTVMNHQEAMAADGLGKSLVFISNTTESTELDLAFRDLAVPILSNEPWFFDELGMTWANDGNRHMNQTSLNVHSTHPLAAGLKGNVRVSHAQISLVWGRPGPGAEWVASAIDNSSLAPIFGYERGAAMQGMVAPARRVGFFLAEDTGSTLTEAGWTLFDAAVRWCADR